MPAHPFCDGVAEKLHDQRQIDLDAHDVVQNLDPTGDPLPHCRRGKVQGVPFPAVIEPAEKSIELGPKAADAAVDPAPRLLPAESVGGRHEQRLRHGLLRYLDQSLSVICRPI